MSTLTVRQTPIEGYNARTSISPPFFYPQALFPFFVSGFPQGPSLPERSVVFWPPETTQSAPPSRPFFGSVRYPPTFNPRLGFPPYVFGYLPLLVFLCLAPLFSLFPPFRTPFPRKDLFFFLVFPGPLFPLLPTRTPAVCPPLVVLSPHVLVPSCPSPPLSPPDPSTLGPVGFFGVQTVVTP